VALGALQRSKRRSQENAVPPKDENNHHTSLVPVIEETRVAIPTRCGLQRPWPEIREKAPGPLVWAVLVLASGHITINCPIHWH
jgi:hypothetical protein